MTNLQAKPASFTIWSPKNCATVTASMISCQNINQSLAQKILSGQKVCYCLIYLRQSFRGADRSRFLLSIIFQFPWHASIFRDQVKQLRVRHVWGLKCTKWNFYFVPVSFGVETGVFELNLPCCRARLTNNLPLWQPIHSTRPDFAPSGKLQTLQTERSSPTAVHLFFSLQTPVAKHPNYEIQPKRTTSNHKTSQLLKCLRKLAFSSARDPSKLKTAYLFLSFFPSSFDAGKIIAR